MLFFLLPIIVLGHMAILIAVINRAHSTSLPRWLLKTGDAFWYVVMAGIPIAIGNWYLQQTMTGQPVEWSTTTGTAIAIYCGLCALSAIVAVADRMYRIVNIRTTELLASNHTEKFSMLDRIGHRPVAGTLTSFCSHLPLNEILQLSVHEKHLILPRLDQRLDGLRITHLSDLHLTGQLTKPYYEELVEQANQWESDFVVLTGDIVEHRPCLEWLPDTLGKLKARQGVYFVLGNHELKIKDEALVRKSLTDLGMIDLGGRARLVRHNEAPILFGGNELPWFTPAVDYDRFSGGEVAEDERPFRILLSHSPDQLRWARLNDVDLMMAGHTHGGQVRLPIIGPILSPSNQGSRFASGTFYYSPTLMHVSRGIAGTRPLRLNCMPELARLVLNSPTG